MILKGEFMDVNNPVIKLCSEGINAEMSGKSTEAYDLYMKAWEIRKDDYDACIASHYIARLQDNPQDILLWNQRSLDYAKVVNDETVKGFFPSLYLNMGKAYQDLGDKENARKNYQLATENLDVLSENSYGDTVRNAVAKRLKELDS